MLLRNHLLKALAVSVAWSAVGCNPSATTVPGPVQLSRIAGWKGAAPRAADAFTFVVLSDRTGGHKPGEWAAAVAEVNLLQPDFVVCVGDLIEGCTDDLQEMRRQWEEFESLTARLDAPFFYCPGNHDITNDTMRAVYQQRHGVAGRSFYSFDYRGCHFIVLDTTAGGELARQQQAWFANDLAAAGNAEHVFIFCHHGLPADGAYARKLRALRRPGTATVFSGHTHTLMHADLGGFDGHILGATGTGGWSSDVSKGTFAMYAQVAVSRGRPTIALVPLHKILPIDHARLTTKITQLRAEFLADSAVPSAGGTITFRRTNRLHVPFTARVSWQAAGWKISPREATLVITPGQTGERTFALTPTSDAPEPPTAKVVYTLHLGPRDEPTTVKATQKLAVSRQSDVLPPAAQTADDDPDH